MNVRELIIDSRSILTGSRAFYCSNNESDWDFVVTLELWLQIKKNIDYAKCIRTDNEGVNYDIGIFGEYLYDIVKYYDNNGEMINLFIFNDLGTVYKFEQINRYMLMFDDIDSKPHRIYHWIQAMSIFEISRKNKYISIDDAESILGRGFKIVH